MRSLDAAQRNPGFWLTPSTTVIKENSHARRTSDIESDRTERRRFYFIFARVGVAAGLGSFGRCRGARREESQIHQLPPRSRRRRDGGGLYESHQSTAGGHAAR